MRAGEGGAGLPPGRPAPGRAEAGSDAAQSRRRGEPRSPDRPVEAGERAGRQRERDGAKLKGS